MQETSSRIMEDKENEFKSRPPRLPSNHGQPLTVPCHLDGYLNRSIDSSAQISPSRGRSSVTRSNPGRSRCSSSSSSNTRRHSKPPRMVTNNHQMINGDESSNQRNGKSRSVDSIKRQATLSRNVPDQSVTSSRSRRDGTPNDDECRGHTVYLHAKNTINANGISDTVDDEHDDVVAYTPQVTRRRGSSNSKYSVTYVSVSNGEHPASNATNAPKKKIRTHSKQHIIKKQDHIGNINSKNSQRARSHSRSNEQRRDRDGEERVKRSTSSYGRIQTHSSEQIRRARSVSKTRCQSIGPTSITGNQSRSVRPKSRSRSTSIREGNSRNRANSLSSFDNQRRRSISRARSVSSSHLAVEPNVHHNAIVETEIECPVIAEMKENELYAIHNGIDL
jgi:hypothetical protein